MTNLELEARNEKLTIEVQATMDLLTAIDLLPDNRSQDELVRQLIRYSTSIGTNYGTASDTRSTRDFINELKKQEIDNEKAKEKLNVLLTEANQLLSIYTPSMEEQQKISFVNNR